jgi:hypothetical protein
VINTTVDVSNKSVKMGYAMPMLLVIGLGCRPALQQKAVPLVHHAAELSRRAHRIRERRPLLVDKVIKIFHLTFEHSKNLP